MRRSTSPVGPLMVPLIAGTFLCAIAAAQAQEADTASQGTIEEAAIAPDELRGSADATAWSFLHNHNSKVEAEDLPEAGTPMAGLDGNAAEKPLSEEERAKLSQALLFEPLDLAAPTKKPLRLRPLVNQSSNGLAVTRTQRSHGLSAVVFDKTIVPAASDWNAKIGADLGMAADATPGSNPDNPLRARRDGRNADAAWASIGVREVATVDARVDAASDQGMLATTFKRSLPIGSDLAMTLQSRTSMTESFGPGTSLSSDIPLMALPSDAVTATPRVWGQENTAKLDILSTGTTLAAAVSANSSDTVAHNSLSAEQKVYGPLRVSTSITDVGQTNESKSLSARLKFNW